VTHPDDPASRPSDTGWPTEPTEPTEPVATPPVAEEPAYDVDAGYDADPAYADAAHVEEPASAEDPAYVEETSYVEEPEYVEEAPYVDEPAYVEEAPYDPAPPYPVASDPEVAQATTSSDATQDVEPMPGDVAAPATARQRSPLRSVPVLALLLTTLLMAIASGFVWYEVHQRSTSDNARRDGLEASRDAALTLLSYDYRTLAKDFSAGRRLTTGDFAKKYAETTTKVVTPVATKQKAVVKAEVVTAGVVRASSDTVVTIVYVNQVTTSSLSAAPKVDLSRVRMTMRKVGDTWLVSNVEAL
jgi:Mce-associated membrane protein